VCDVQVLHEGSRADAASPSVPTGPAQVATEDYRLNWDRVFGSAHRAKRDTSLN
jgi:hypothetical protein